MCGVVGIHFTDSVEIKSCQLEEELCRCRNMLSALEYRGPDEQQVVNFGLSILGHARLSIIDLHTGSQPIYNEDKSVAIVFNGEIYNFQELRSELKGKGHIFSTNTDTEVIVHLYEELGSDCLCELEGMFAILLYDKSKNIFLVARDRMGEKPLLYWEGKNKLIVASELKALLRYPEISHSINYDALSLYFSSMYVPAPYSILEGVRKLPPAHYIIVEKGRTTVQQYWRPKIEVDWSITEQEATEHFKWLFANSIDSRRVADVPLGVFLSGGIDSSAVTAFMARNNGDTVKTFSVGFGDEVDERPFARLVANRYKTDHTEIFVSQKIEDVFFEAIQYYDEPFGDSSAIPTYLVAREARKHVKVVLTGDGGDEIFAGYSAYLNQRDLIGGRLTTKLYKFLKRFSYKIGIKCLDNIYSKKGNRRAWEHWFGVRTVFPLDELKRLIGLERLSITPYFFFQDNRWLPFIEKDPLSIAFAHDLNFYLPDDLLKKVDMASMHASLECRAPFLDHKLVEFAMSISPLLKLRYGDLKYILKKSLEPYLPTEILYRPKVGFGAPVISWMRGQLKDAVLDMLHHGCMAELYVNRQEINSIMNQFYQQNSSNYRTAFKLWLIFIFEVYLQKYLSK